MRTNDLTAVCAHCKAEHEAVSAARDIGAAMPKGGSLALCFKCGEWNVFEADLQLRKPTDEEYMQIGQDKNAAQIRQAWVKVQENIKEHKTNPGRESIVEEKFRLVQEQFDTGNMPPSAVSLMKLVFAYGGLTVYELMLSSLNPLESGAKVMDYKKELLAFISKELA